MDVRVSRSAVGGTVAAPPSKSYTHRAILAAGYGDGAVVHDPLMSADTKATIRAVERFGGTVDYDPEAGALDVEGFDGTPAVPADVIDCGNSGTTIRLTAGAAALADGGTVLTGDGSLRSRPQGPLLEAIDDLGGEAQSTRRNGQAPLVVWGDVDGGAVAMPGDVSSQYVTSLLMAGAVSADGIEIELTTELKSAPYVDITLELLADFGVEAEPIGTETAAGADGFRVAGGQRYGPEGGAYRVPGDFSSISYLLAAGAVAGDADRPVRIEGARPSAQGDTAIVEILRAMGADVEWDREAGVLVARGGDLTGTTVDVGDTPDLLPTIAAVGAVADGETVMENVEHVRYKETDRVAAMATELETLGAAVTEREDSLTVHGGASDLVGAAVEGYHDHRVIMALAIAGLAADGTTTIPEADHVDVSYPDFFEALAGLGADVDRAE